MAVEVTLELPRGDQTPSLTHNAQRPSTSKMTMAAATEGAGRRRRRPPPSSPAAGRGPLVLASAILAAFAPGGGNDVGVVGGCAAAFSPFPISRPRPRASAVSSLGAESDGTDGVAALNVGAPVPPPSSSGGSKGAPPWMKCVNAPVPPHVRALNEAVSTVANVTLCQANELIERGAVWARMETLDEDDVLGQYDGSGGGGGAALRYADLPSGWGSGSENDERNLFGEGGGEAETLDEYVARVESLRYRRILTPSTVEPGTDLRIYPRPRRFPACYDLADPERLLYEDTTFLVVDKPPMLPTQPEPSNYEECCPGCVDLLMGPFQTITGEEVPRPLICHRVDSCVGGCVVLSKDGNGQRVFSELQRERKIKKVYLAVTTEPVPIGRHVHWMWAPLNKRGQSGGTPCQFVSHVPPASRKKAKVSVCAYRVRVSCACSDMGEGRSRSRTRILFQ